MKKILKWVGSFFLIVAIIILSFVHFYGPTVGAKLGMPIYLFPPSVERYGKVSIEIMDSSGYYTNNQAWEEQKEKALNEMKTLSSYEEAYPIIEESLKVAGGKHSTLIAKEDLSDKQMEDKMPVVERIEDIGMIELPAIMDSQSNGKEYAEIVLDFLQENQDISGVVIDLQNNTGGDMGPMVTSVAPLLPDGEILFFVASEKEWPVTLEKGRISGGGTDIETAIQPFKLDVPVAILTNEMTASAAEAVLMSFIDLDRVQTFGKPTAGYASSNYPFPLFDETIMFLTTAFNQTPQGQIFYEEPIPVDVETDHPLEEAINWLNSY